jgi:hypothetical protein
MFTGIHPTGYADILQHSLGDATQKYVTYPMPFILCRYFKKIFLLSIPKSILNVKRYNDIKMKKSHRLHLLTSKTQASAMCLTLIDSKKSLYLIIKGDHAVAAKRQLPKMFSTHNV